MQSTWKPAPGQVALIEPDGTDDQVLTGVVLESEAGIVVDLGASPLSPSGPCEVVASFFAPDALYRVRATADAHEERREVIDLTMHDVERVQRRDSPRAKIELKAVLSNLDEPGEMLSVLGTTIDLATGGCRIRTSKSFPPGCDPTVSIDLPDGSAVVALAAVVQAEPRDGQWEYRLVFMDLDDSARDHLAHLVDASA
jgi:hypothetical protein